jgi:hypothetical protein
MMKVLFYTASLTLTTVSAQLQMDTIVDLAEQSLKLMNKTLPRYRGRNSVNAMFSDLQRYGCWCHFDAEHGKGKGTPVDRFDMECMNHHHATTCMKMENCDLTVPSIPQLVITNDGNIAYDCVIANGGDACKEANCYTATHFLSKVLDIMIDPATGELPRYNAYSASRGFDQSTCKLAGAGSNIDEEKCCGSYDFNTKRPVRVPSGKSRECCENSFGIFVTYNPDFKTCCNGKVESFGSC